MMTTTVQTATAVGYFRVSTPGQAGERHVSLEVQESIFQDYCRLHGLFSVSTFTDIASGRKDSRPEYQRMLRYIPEHGVGRVVVLFLDRFGRNPKEILRRYWELEERGVQVESVNEDLKEELLLLVRAGIAGAESKRTGERVKAALYRASEKGTQVGRPPYGYTKIREGSSERWEQVPEEVEAIRLAYRLSVEENLGYKLIADELNRQGFRMKSERGGKPFAGEKVKYILRNPALKGQMRYGVGEIKEGVYPGVLSPDEWERLQERLQIRSEGKLRGPTHRSDYLLSGITRCGECNGSVTGHKGGPGQYYVCSSHRRASVMCQGIGQHRKGKLEAAVLEYLGQFSDPEAVKALLAKPGVAALDNSTQELTRAQGRLKELETAFLADLDRVDRGVLTESEYVMRQEVRRTETETLQRRATQLSEAMSAEKHMEEQAKAVPIKVGTFLEDFQTLPIREAKAILQTILRSIKIWKDGKIELEFREVDHGPRNADKD